MDKLMFWKKKDDFSDLGLGNKDPLGKNPLGKNLAFGDDFGLGGQQPTGLGPTGVDQLSTGMQSPQAPPQQSYPQPSFQPQQPQFQQPRYENPQQDMTAKNIELISSKLDALRASVESVNQRLANLEAVARGEEDHRRKRYY
tara:strand:+ start:677 stop:1102 length:426 start_codon:yes stop_codon:yes gene_type:complete